MLIREGTCWPPTFGMGAPSPFSPAVGNAPRRATQGDEAAEGVDPPRELLLICALQRLAGEAGSPIFLAPFPGAFPLTPAPGLAQIQVHPPPRSWPCGRRRPGHRRAQLHSAGALGGKINRPRGWAGDTPDPAASPAPGPLSRPGSSFANEKGPGKGGEPGTALAAGPPGEAAPRSPASGSVSGAADFVPPGPAQVPAPLPEPTRRSGGYSAFLCRGKAGAPRGRCAPALPLAPAPGPGAGTWVRFIFGAAKWGFFPRGELVARGGMSGR